MGGIGARNVSPMAKPSSPLQADRKAPQPREHRYIGALVADDFGGMRALTLATANSFARKKLDASSQALQLRSERQEKKVRRADARESAAAARSVDAEMREGDRRIQLFWRRMTTKARPEKTVRHKPPKARKRAWPYASVALPRYDAPVIDRGGERGVFVRMRYYSRRTAGAGVSQRVLLYCYHGAALDADGVPYARSNIGETIDEALCGVDHLEQVNWSAQKNAKILMHGIFAVDHRQTPDQMMQVGTRWAEETLAQFDLPYLVTLHAPPEDGNAKNWHLHILWSYRPMVRTGDHEWQVAEMLRTDLDNPAAMKVFREMYAAVMTDVSIEAGQNQVWTAKSNADRGLVHEPQDHLGGARTNRARQGEHVPANEENHERVMRSKAAVLDEELRHAEEALAREQEVQRAIARRWARLPALPIRVPQRAIAAALSASLPEVVQPGARSIVLTPAMIPPVRIMAAQPAATIPSLTQAGLPRVNDRVRFDGIEARPTVPAQTAVPEIANLRFTPLSRSDRPIATALNVPGIWTIVPTVAGLPALVSAALGQARTPSRSLPAEPPGRAAATILPVAPLDRGAAPRAITMSPAIAMPTRVVVTPTTRPLQPVTPPAPTVDLASIGRVITRVVDARRRDDERRDRELADAERASAAAAERTAAGDRQREALASLFAAIAEERHFLAKDKGVPVVDPRLLARFGLTPADVASDAARKRIAKIAELHAVEVARIATYVEQAPHHLVRDGDGWMLDAAAPADVRALVAAWQRDATMQRALGRVVAARPAEAPPRDRVQTLPPDDPGTAWRRARTVREHAMTAARQSGCERSDNQDENREGVRRCRA